MRSMRKAIDLNCRQCIYDPFVKGTWRQQTQACEITKCPLWDFRPKSRAKGNSRSLPVTLPLTDPTYVEDSALLGSKTSVGAI